MSELDADNLSDLIRKTVKRGKLTYLSIISDGSMFKAVYRGVDSADHRFADSTDPVAAIAEALTGKRQKIEPPAKPKKDKPVVAKVAAPISDEDLL